VSMLRADLLDAIDECLRMNLDNDAPFGGKQVVFIGDVFQLSPVQNAYESELETADRYNNPYFFSARVFQQVMPRLIELKKIYRQNDENFIYLLNRVRMGLASADDFDELNKKFAEPVEETPFAVTLTSVNHIADVLNQKKLMMLRSNPFSFTAQVEGNFHPKLYPAPLSLQLKKGAQVMMVKNDLHGLWVNGSIGVVEEVSEKSIAVRFKSGDVHTIQRVVWENKVYAWDRTQKKITFEVVGTFVQYPIRLAWAITIHKSQGLTFDNIDIDMGRGAFAHGQLYVALSRCRTLEGIRLATRLRPEDMIVDEAVERFAGKFRML
jgi:ATP-dependent DNA helicase PIF1